MTKKSTEPTKKTKQGLMPLLIGLGMILISPAVAFFYFSLNPLLCQKSVYGNCTYDSSAQLWFMFLCLAAIWLVTSLAFIIYGIAKLIVSRL